MSDRHDYLALDWVRGEIQETLNQAQQALEAFVDTPDDATRMRFCQAHLHQVYGTLQMVEFYGAALLAEEMEKLAQALLEGRVGNVADGQETLMRAILQLPPIWTGWPATAATCRWCCCRCSTTCAPPVANRCCRKPPCSNRI